MGVVYRAEDVFLGRTVAIKVVGPSHDDEGTHERFLKEARALARIRHDDVVQVTRVTYRADIYAFAGTVFELLVGRCSTSTIRSAS